MAERFKTLEDAVRLGAQMRIARLRGKMTLIRLSKQTGVDAGQISKMERGQMATLSPNVLKICNFLALQATAGDPPSTRAGRRLDALIAGTPGSEKAAAKLIAAIEDFILGAAIPSRNERLSEGSGRGER